MIKHTVFIIYFLIIYLFTFTEAIITLKSKDEYSLQVLTTKKLFDFKNSIQKEILNKHLKQREFTHALKFEGLMLEDLDLSGMYLKGIDFSGCEFINVNFNNADLRETNFQNCTFKNMDLRDAILYYSFETSEEEVHKKGVKMNYKDHYSLIKRYSDLIKESKDCELKELHKESQNLMQQAKCLNKFFPALKIHLSYGEPKQFHFDKVVLKDVRSTFIDLTKSHLAGANLGYIRLQWVDLTNSDLTEINLQGSDLFFSILNKTDLRKANLQDAYLYKAQLKGANLTGANLENSYLCEAELQGVNLTGANLAGVRLSKDYRLPIDLKEEDLPKIYNDCSDNEVKKLLKDILIAKKYSIE